MHRIKAANNLILQSNNFYAESMAIGKTYKFKAITTS